MEQSNWNTIPIATISNWSYLINFKIYYNNTIINIFVNSDLTVYELWLLIKSKLNLTEDDHYSLYNNDIYKKIKNIMIFNTDIVSVIDKFKEKIEYEPKYILFNSFYLEDFDRGPNKLNQLFKNTKYELIIIKRNFTLVMMKYLSILNKQKKLSDYIKDKSFSTIIKLDNYNFFKNINSVDLYLYILNKSENNILLLQYASENLKNNDKVVFKSLKKNPENITPLKI
jgi:hypothetical protein